MKEKFLKFIKGLVTGLSIIGFVLSATAGIMTAFYAELSEVFMTFGWPQERLVWLTVALTALSSGGLIVTRALSFINTAIATTQLQANKLVNDLSVNVDQRFAKNEKEIKDILAERKKTNELLQSINKFNEIQAQKGLEAPDRLVSTKLKNEYAEFLKKKI